MSANFEWSSQGAESLEILQDDPHGQIARIEERIEELAQSAERCRKLAFFAKAAVLVGGAWMLALAVGVIPSGPIGLIGSTTALIGGIVLFGSNTSTARQIAADIAAAEARRADLIGGMALREVSKP